MRFSTPQGGKTAYADIYVYIFESKWYALCAKLWRRLVDGTGGQMMKDEFDEPADESTGKER